MLRHSHEMMVLSVCVFNKQVTRACTSWQPPAAATSTIFFADACAGVDQGLATYMDERVYQRQWLWLNPRAPVDGMHELNDAFACCTMMARFVALCCAMTAAVLHCGVQPGYQSLHELAAACGCSISHWEPQPAAGSAGAAGSGGLEFNIEEARVSSNICQGRCSHIISMAMITQAGLYGLH